LGLKEALTPLGNPMLTTDVAIETILGSERDRALSRWLPCVTVKLLGGPRV